MAHTMLSEGMPGIRDPIIFHCGTAKPMTELAYVLNCAIACRRGLIAMAAGAM